jgi:hypothetical protein
MGLVGFGRGKRLIEVLLSYEMSEMVREKKEEATVEDTALFGLDYSSAHKEKVVDVIFSHHQEPHEDPWVARK